MKMTTLQDLYVEELKDIYNAEQQLLKALPKMAKAASSEQLKTAFKDHLEQTQTHVQRLETIFEALDQTPKGKKCKGMEGVIAEGTEMIEEDADPEVKDAGLISAAQRAEHYEMAAYGCVRTYAQLLGEDEAADLLQTTLDEEGDADKKLTELSKAINVEAAEGEDAEAEAEAASETVPPASNRAKASSKSGRGPAR